MRFNIKIKWGLIIIFALCILSGCAQPLTPVSALNAIADTEIEEWDLLWVSDSSGWNVADIYGEYLTEDLGIKVNVLDKWKGGLPAGKLLKALQGEKTGDNDLDKIREYVEQAEIIVIYGNPEWSGSDENPGDWNCGQHISKCYVNACNMDTFEVYIEHLKEIYSIIYEIRKGKPTMLRAFDAYNPKLVSQCTPDDVFNACRACWENYNKAIHQAADEMGVPVANAFDAWNGLDHTEDPNDKGFTQSDRIHPNKKGAAVIAGLLRDIGYEMVTP
jgi:hypothetical protein